MFSVSASANSFNFSDFTVEYKDDNSPFWSSYIQILSYGAFFSASNNWYNFIMMFPYDKPTSFSLKRTNVWLRLSSSSGKTYIFKDIKLIFNQALTNDGLTTYRTIGGRNNDDISFYIKRGIATKIE